MSFPFERHQMTPLEIAVWATRYCLNQETRRSHALPTVDSVTEAIEVADRAVIQLREAFEREHAELKLKAARDQHVLRVRYVNGIPATYQCSCGYKAPEHYGIEEMMTLHLCAMRAMPPGEPLGLSEHCAKLKCRPGDPCAPCAAVQPVSPSK